MRKIKFRGKTFRDELVYGDLIQSNGESSIFDGTHRKYVKPESVVQFIGYDKNGAEIYSDDKVIDLNGEEILFEDAVINFAEIGGKFDDLILKK